MMIPAEAEWLPTQYQDEVIPPLRATPQAWLMQMADGAWGLAAAEDKDPPTLLVDGAVIAFDYCVDIGRGSLLVTTDEDVGTTWDTDFEFTETPPGMHLCVRVEYEDISPSFEEAASEAGAGDHFVQAYAWSDEPVRYRFAAGKLEPVDA